MSRPRIVSWPLGFLIAGAVLAGCTPAIGGLGTVPPPPSAAPPSVGQASPDLLAGPGPSTSASSPLPSARPAQSPAAASETQSSGETSVIRAYFHLNGRPGSAGLVPVLREVPATRAVATAAVTALLAGPSAEEERAMSSTIPAGTRLLGLSIASGVAMVDLSSEFDSGGGSASVIGRLAQVVFTLTQFPTVTSVSFRVEGRIVTVFSGEGVVLNRSVARADYEDLLPAIFVDRPAYGAALGNADRITGSANVFEGTFQVSVIDRAGSAVAHQIVMATCGTGCRGTFSMALSYGVAEPQWGTLRVWEASARDGSAVNVRDYPVWLTPATR